MRDKILRVDFLILLFFLIGLFSRLFFIEKVQSHMDGPQYTMAILHYDLKNATPSVPGYPLYIATARLINYIISDPYNSLILVSVLFSGIGAYVVFFTGKQIFNKSVGIIASLIFLSGAAFYFLGITTYGYIVSSVMTVVLAYIVYEISVSKKQHGILLGFFFSLALGVRPQELFFIGPLFIFGLFYLNLKNKIIALVSFLVSFFCWFIPLVSTVGGLKNYILLVNSFQHGLVISPNNIYNNSQSMIRGFVLAFGLGNLFLIYFLFKRIRLIQKNKLITYLKNKQFLFFLIWILPSLAFNFFIRSDHPGYQMTYLTAFLFLISYAIWVLNRRNIFRMVLVVSCIIIFNLFWFFRDRDPGNKLPYTPTSFHYSEIRKNDARMASKVDFIKNYSEFSYAIITGSVFWRQFMYYFPDQEIYDLEGLVTENIPWKYGFRKGYKWRYIEYNTKEFIFTVPKNIHSIIFTDDEAQFWQISGEKKIYRFPANASITIVRVSPEEKYEYSLGVFKKNNEK
ncbi:MAG: glycosyltransferase family 39 protein [Patescibacteria group bacterium]|nr:glycosyltransferase family 39 protein [Patescibacteria group bacterium]